MTAPAPAALPWADHLDALEEWLRRGRALLESGDAAGLPALTSAPVGPLPAALHLRAAAGLQELERLLLLGERRRQELARSQAYSRC